MSRIMLLGVLLMPEELVVSVMGHKLMAMQHVSRYHEAANVIEEQDRRIEELERELAEARSVITDGFPDDLRQRILELGPVEWGAVGPQIAEKHIHDFIDTLEITRKEFNLPVKTELHGVYTEGENKIVCHTGTSPNSASHARIIVALLNWLYQKLTPATAPEEVKP